MKLVLSLSIIVFICTSYKTSTFVDPLITLNITQQNRKADTSTIKVFITNNSSDTIRYQSMSCSWYDYFKTDSKTWKLLEHNDCYKNGFKVEKIPPHQSKERMLHIIRTKISSANVNSSVRLGFNFIPIQNAPDLISARKMAKTAITNKIIWSNAIIIHP